ncbi:MAG TPA: hypothetical protein VFT72_19450 [Opitutaceae bacterium]|nr:hypothetical protein [Opitutaceae bacterium]
MSLHMAVVEPLLAQAKSITLPTQFADIISFAIIAVLAGCSVTAMIKIGMGFKQWIRGEDAFAEIKSGFLIAGVPWAVQAAFNGVGVYEKLGIPMVPRDAILPSEMQTLLQYGLWVIIALFLAVAMYVGLEGAQKTSRGEDGMRMIWGAFGIAGAPWLMIAAFKLAGFWDAFGVKLL